ncbi:hypothetical protein NQZ79_g7319 [Umbelopsis isabellina]|nr:hypothetical protein NQZ79_g7319 [Umbelopsis isabellina]
MHDTGTGHVAGKVGPAMDAPFPNNSKSTPVPSSRRKPSRTRTSDQDASDEFFSTPASQAMPMAGNLAFDPYPAAQPLAKHPSRRMTSGSSERSKKSKLEVLNDPLLHQTFLYRPRGLAQELFPSHLVGYAEYGIPDGHPVIVIGGLGCSRLVGVMFHEISKRHKIRMLIPERMGYGLTEACSATDMTVLQWADVVIQFADHLGIQRFSLIGQSVGAVFSLAVATLHPERVAGTVHLISPWVPTSAANTFRWTKRLPGGLMTRTLSLGMDAMWGISKATTMGSTQNWLAVETSQRSSSESLNSSISGKNPSMTSPTSSNFQHALMALEDDELLAALDEDYEDLPTDFPPHRPLRHMVRLQQISLFQSMNKMRMAEPSSQGQTNDVLVALEKYHSFGFNFSDVQVPVSVVWGDQDNLIPLRGIEWMASMMKDVRVKVLEGEGHDLVWKEGVMEWAIRGIQASVR